MTGVMQLHRPNLEGVAQVPDFNDARPVFAQIADDLRQQIKQGDLAVGTRLPSQATLAGHYGVALNTLRTALRELVDEGIVSTQSTRGTFVLKVPGEPEPSSEFLEVLGHLKGMSERMDSLGGQIESLARRVQELEIERPSRPERQPGAEGRMLDPQDDPDGSTGD